jgi:hypothetical protein
MVNRVAIKFISNHSFDPDRALKPVKTDWDAALKRLPKMVNFPIDIAGRDPRNPLSYSVVKPEEIEERRRQIQLIKARSRAFLATYGQEERYDGDTSRIETK